jgi:hypothetical protein
MVLPCVSGPVQLLRSKVPQAVQGLGAHEPTGL